MENESIKENVERYIEKYEIQDFKTLKSQTQNQLLSIEKYLQDCQEMYNNCITTINNINVSVRGICEGANVSKSTIYNNPEVLKRYIESRISDMNITGIANLTEKQKIKQLEGSLQEVNEVLGNNIANFVKNANNEHKIKEYEKEIQRQQKLIETNVAERVKLSKELNGLKQKLRAYENNDNKILPITLQL